MADRVRTVSMLALVLAGSAGCGEGHCLAMCLSSNNVHFEPAIGAPGHYTVSVGSLTSSFELPTAVWRSGGSSYGTEFDFENYSLAGASIQEKARSTITVQVERDGVVVLSQVIEADSISHGSVCGMECSQAQFTVPVPGELAAPARGLCDPATIEGTYALTESTPYGSCSDFLADKTLTFSAGVPQSGDEGCTGALVQSSAEECTFTSRWACQGSSLDASWELSLTDVLGDGSTLLGLGKVEMRAPIACAGTAPIELRR